MTEYGALTLQLLQNASLLAFVIVCYGAIKRRRLAARLEQGVLGVMFGLGSVALMALSIDVSPDVHLSARSIPVALAAFSGPLAALITVVISIAFQFWHTTDGAFASSLAIVATALITLAGAELR